MQAAMQATAVTSPIHTLPPCDAVTQYLLRLGDSSLILGHRLSEWAGHAPTLEEDIALSNVGLDHIGAARLLLAEAGSRMHPPLSEDDLAYWREPAAWRGYTACELPNSGIEKGQHARDFGFTIVRNALFAAYAALLWESLCNSSDTALAGIAAKAVKEARYHYTHASSWVIRLGNGTAQSHAKVQAALNALWPYCNEWFMDDAVTQACHAAGVAPLHASIQPRWDEIVNTLFTASDLKRPSQSHFASKGAQGLPSEHLGFLLAEMQSVARAHPGASW
jgi:ring-1,2-phenylacetyl-CoA epoxidase subunit PaaC